MKSGESRAFRMNYQRPETEFPPMRLPRVRFTIGGLMIVIAYVAAAFAFPEITLMAMGSLAMIIGSVVLATILASPALLLRSIIERHNRRNRLVVPDRQNIVKPDSVLQSANNEVETRVDDLPSLQ
jgi:hypothetical protein